ncbi:MAG: glycosyltransferase [Desulfovibrionaceae bacterium]|nr:glycosyltransferase [Desulfovibrionaceae bacterium]
MNPRTFLFIHQAFPAQFKGIAKALAAEGHKVYALTMQESDKAPGVRVLRYAPVRAPQYDNWPYLLKEMDSKLIRAESVYKAAKLMKEKGFNPDVIYAHPGWGEGLFIKSVWPEARYIVYAEWFYNLYNQEVNFDPAMPKMTEENELRLALKNMSFLYALSECDAAIAPTEWQKSRSPKWAQEKIHVINEGLNLTELAAVKPRSLGIPSQNLKLKYGMPIVTFAARNLEPVRGFHYFMRSLPKVLAEKEDAHVIIMGHDAGVMNRGYGSNNPDGMSWRKSLEKELGNTVDWNRIHFLGFLERKLYLAMLKLSACHVYLTTPFILSWSFLEAAALGLPIVSSKTPPVEEFKDLEGLTLVDFTDVDGLADAILANLNNMKTEFFDSNLEAIRKLDEKVTIPRMKEVLLEGVSAKTFGGKLEDVVMEDEDEGEEQPSKASEKADEDDEEESKKSKRTVRKKAPKPADDDEGDSDEDEKKKVKEPKEAPKKKRSSKK